MRFYSETPFSNLSGVVRTRGKFLTFFCRWCLWTNKKVEFSAFHSRPEWRRCLRTSVRSRRNMRKQNLRLSQRVDWNRLYTGWVGKMFLFLIMLLFFLKKKRSLSKEFRWFKDRCKRYSFAVLVWQACHQCPLQIASFRSNRQAAGEFARHYWSCFFGICVALFRPNESFHSTVVRSILHLKILSSLVWQLQRWVNVCFVYFFRGLLACMFE